MPRMRLLSALGLAGLCLLSGACLELFPLPTPEIHGQVVDKEAGAPIADAVVMVSWETYGGFPIPGSSPPAEIRFATTDAEGRFMIPSYTLQPGFFLGGTRSCPVYETYHREYGKTTGFRGDDDYYRHAQDDAPSPKCYSVVIEMERDEQTMRWLEDP